MRKFWIAVFLVAISIGSMGIHPSFASYEIDFDDHQATDDRDPMTGLYDDLGIYFEADSTGLTDPAILYYPCTVIPGESENDIYWYPQTEISDGVYEDLPDYPYPTSQYLALEKPENATDDDGMITGVAIQFDYSPTQLAFKFRRPGSNDTTTKITISYFDTSISQEAFFSEQITAYVYTPAENDPDGDGWQEYISNLDTAFNLVLLSGSKQFAIDDLAVTTLADADGNYPEDQLTGDGDTAGDDTTGDASTPDAGEGDDDSGSSCFITTLSGE